MTTEPRAGSVMTEDRWLSIKASLYGQGGLDKDVFNGDVLLLIAMLENYHKDRAALVMRAEAAERLRPFVEHLPRCPAHVDGDNACKCGLSVVWAALTARGGEGG